MSIHVSNCTPLLVQKILVVKIQLRLSSTGVGRFQTCEKTETEAEATLITMEGPKKRYSRVLDRIPAIRRFIRAEGWVSPEMSNWTFLRSGLFQTFTQDFSVQFVDLVFSSSWSHVWRFSLTVRFWNVSLLLLFFTFGRSFRGRLKIMNSWTIASTIFSPRRQWSAKSRALVQETDVPRLPSV